jgi:hypothetical protein
MKVMCPCCTSTRRWHTNIQAHYMCRRWWWHVTKSAYMWPGTNWTFLPELDKVPIQSLPRSSRFSLRYKCLFTLCLVDVVPVFYYEPWFCTIQESRNSIGNLIATEMEPIQSQTHKQLWTPSRRLYCACPTTRTVKWENRKKKMPRPQVQIEWPCSL